MFKRVQFLEKMGFESIEEYNENGQKSHPFEPFLDFLSKKGRY